VKATLHDELMRAAGFETDYYVELEQRRERRRKKLRLDVLRATRIVALVCALTWAVVETADVAGKTDHLPRPLLYGAIVALNVGVAADLLVRRMTRDEDDPPRRGVLWVWDRVARRRGKEDTR
jgi:hypothetical protein